MPIRRLSPLLVNQIAAGEVIERPASVVKECIENSIDAGATRIDVAIENGGRDLIRIADNGSGIPLDELTLAIAPHATSKIEKQEDLDAIATMGFRGEALASIASISRLSIVSRPPASAEAGMIEIEGDRITGPRPCGGPPGTAIAVRNLFFNTPARRKFLKTDQTESGRVSDIVQNLALAHPTIAFTLRIDDRLTLELPPDQSPRRRVLDVLGTELDEQMLELSISERGMTLWGMIGKPEVARGTAKHLRLFLNGRPIADRSIMHAIKEAYRGLIEPSRYPMVVLFVQMPPDQVDVNVHPTKSEVRFRNQGVVHGTVLSAVRSVLREHDLTPRFDFARAGNGSASTLAIPPLPPAEFGSGRAGGGGANTIGEQSASETSGGAASFVEYFRRLDPKQKGFVFSEVKQALRDEAPEMLRDENDDAEDATTAGVLRHAGEDGGAPSLPMLTAAKHILQVHSSYIVTQDEDGLVIIDQHALHERVMFEKLRHRLESGPLESQRLLMPATVEVDRSQIELLTELSPLLARLGIEVEPIGPKAIAIHAFTSLLFERKVEPGDFLRELLRRADEEGLAGDSEAAIHEVLDMMACKAAIKAGDRLTPDELADLIRYREQIERSSNCPHGRPTSLRLSLRDLEKQFGRR
jgi:DNA mismatch repair protein MutL